MEKIAKDPSEYKKLYDEYHKHANRVKLLEQSVNSAASWAGVAGSKFWNWFGARDL